MKKIIFIALVGAFAFSGCSKSEPDVYGCMDPTSVNYNSKATKDNGTCKYEGTIMFWTNFNTESTVTVTINGEKHYITKYFATYNPDCGNTDGCATFKLAPGNYSYEAHDDGGRYSWKDNFTITKNQCDRYLLHI